MIQSQPNQAIPQGIYPDLPWEHYRADPSLGSGDVKEALRSPAHFLAKRQGEDKDTPAKRFGRAYHAAILEPASWPARYIEKPDGIDRRTTKGKEAWAEFERMAHGREIMDGGEVELIRAMTAALHANAGARYLLTGGGLTECSGFWTDPDTGLPCKMRLDLLRKDDVVADLKTVEDASPEAFARSVHNYGWHIQAGHYTPGLIALGRTPRAFVFIAQEKEPPYAVGCYTLDPSAIELGMAQRNRALNALAKCYAEDVWPAYGDEIRNLMLPAWAYRAAANDNTPTAE